ncbi:hypothetical protein PCANC_03216 [Puccinia coronata f. sp. avenae]|uniref:Integrase catalytic domain-containing protein n=1 Tax=Puccinia coronata f. sp. avenae TaxID=200324 RepID=A0A2N5T852_9BASI|nr:hypothetical protein PCANC_03216 [Puccinia coronata f. sp. avenae]
MTDRIKTTFKTNYLPVLDGTNYTNWAGRLKVHLRGKGLWDVCMAGLTMPATDDDQLNQYASHSVVNCGRVYMKWSNLSYDGNLQVYINQTRASLLNIKTVNITIPKELVLYLILGKLLNKDLDQVVNKIVLSPNCTKDPYLVLNALQTYHTHKLNKLTPNPATALVAATPTSKFPFKVVHYCGYGKHNPEVTSHTESRCFEKYPHLGKAAKAAKNVSASLAHALVFVASARLQMQDSFIVDSVASHHMLSNRSLFTHMTPSGLNIKTGCSTSLLQAEGTGDASIVIGGRVIVLRDLLYVPCISQQLISLVRLIDSLATITKKADRFTTAMLSRSSNATHTVWHRRLGHPAEKTMQLMDLPMAPSNALCEAKLGTLSAFRDFAALVENIQGVKIKEVVSDRGGEFTSLCFRDFMAQKGMLQNFLPPETPEQNGYAERANRTILDKACCLLLDSDLPNKYWVEAINTTTFLCNMVFGSKVYTAIPKSKRSWKLGKTREQGVLVGYESEATVYRILRLSDGKLIRSRHAVFDKTSFPQIANSSLPASVFDSIDDYLVEEVSVSTPILPTAASPVPVEQIVTPQHNLLDSLDASLRSSNLIIGDVTSANIFPYCRRAAQAFVTTTTSHIPAHYNQAIRCSDSTHWIAAINSELAAMERLARLCTQGFSQTQGVDFSKTFSPTGWLNPLRSLMSFVAAKNLDFQQMDVKTAFLNAILDEEVYLSVSQGVQLDNKQKCLKLKEAIYGLKQAPLAWYNLLSAWLLFVGFVAAVADPCVFYRMDKSPVWLFIHVEDITIFGKDLSYFKVQIKAKFDMKDMGQADMLLGIKIIHEPSALILSQAHYTTSILELYGMTNCQTVSTPLVQNTHLVPATIEEVDRFNCLGVNFRSAVGSLSYLSSATRPDIAFAVSSLLQYLESPGILHWEAFSHVLRYLAGTESLSLLSINAVLLPPCVVIRTPTGATA